MNYLREWRREFAAWAVWIAALCWIASSAAAPPQAESPPSAKQEEPKTQDSGDATTARGDDQPKLKVGDEAPKLEIEEWLGLAEGAAAPMSVREK